MVKLKKRLYELYDTRFDINITFDNTNFVMNQIDLGHIDATLSMYAGAGQFGTTITNRTLGTRDVFISGYILADDEGQMMTLKRRLESVVLPISDFFLLVDDTYKLRCTARGSIQYSPSWFENNQMIAKFNLDAVCSNPFFETKTPVNAEITNWIKDFHFPVKFEPEQRFTFGHQNPNKVSVVRNEGDPPSSLLISFKAVNGTVVNPWIRNAATGEYMYLETTMQNGEEIQIDTTYGNKSVVNTTTGKNLLASLHLTSTFLMIPKGQSIFTFGTHGKSTGTMQCYIKYIPRYVAV